MPQQHVLGIERMIDDEGLKEGAVVVVDLAIRGRHLQVADHLGRAVVRALHTVPDGRPRSADGRGVLPYRRAAV